MRFGRLVHAAHLAVGFGGFGGPHPDEDLVVPGHGLRHFRHRVRRLGARTPDIPLVEVGGQEP